MRSDHTSVMYVELADSYRLVCLFANARTNAHTTSRLRFCRTLLILVDVFTGPTAKHS